VAEPNLLFEFAIVALNAPAQLGGVREMISPSGPRSTWPCASAVSRSTLRHPQLCFDEVETGIFTLEFGAQPSWKRQFLPVRKSKNQCANVALSARRREYLVRIATL
jgi:hypothetical protein